MQRAAIIERREKIKKQTIQNRRLNHHDKRHIRVEKPSELSSALQHAFEAERPVVIDVVSDIDAFASLAVT